MIGIVRDCSGSVRDCSGLFGIVREVFGIVRDCSGLFGIVRHCTKGRTIQNKTDHHTGGQKVIQRNDQNTQYIEMESYSYTCILALYVNKSPNFLSYCLMKHLMILRTDGQTQKRNMNAYHGHGFH